MNEVVITYSKAKILFRWFALLIAVILFECVPYVFRVTSTGSDDHVYSYAIQFILALFFIWVSYYGLKLLFEEKPGLTFTCSEFYDNSSGTPAGFVPWSEVIGVEKGHIPTGRYWRHKVLFINVKLPENFVEEGSTTQRLAKKANRRILGSAIVISSSLLKISFGELCNVFDDYLVHYKRNA